MQQLLERLDVDGVVQLVLIPIHPTCFERLDKRAYPCLQAEEDVKRFDADWMSRADYRILEHLAEEDPNTPKKMADSDRVRFSRQHINARCKTLVTYGHLVHLGNGVYDITRNGNQYLAGDLDARDLEGK